MVIRPQGAKHSLQIVKPPSVNASAWPTTSQQDLLDDGSCALTCVLAREGWALTVLGTRWPEALLVLQSHSSLAGQTLDKSDLKPHRRVWLAVRGGVPWEGSGSSFAPGLPGEGAEELLRLLVWKADLCPGTMPARHPPAVLPPVWLRLQSSSRAGPGPEWALSPCLPHPGVSLGGLEDLPRDLAASEHALPESCLVGVGLVTRATGAGL